LAQERLALQPLHPTSVDRDHFQRSQPGPRIFDIMGLLRSEEMAYGMLVLPPQDARKFIELIGKDEGAKVQFEDMNAQGMKRPYKKYIQRIDEMERILRFIGDEIASNSNLEVETNHIEEFLAHETYQLEPVEKELQELYQQFVKFQDNNAQLVAELVQAKEEIKVMETAMDWLEHNENQGNLAQPLLSSERRLNNVAGVVAEADKERFRRALWRASRGNTFVEFNQIVERGQYTCDKSVFVVYFQNSPDGSTQSAMMSKVMKVCSAFGVRQYNWPADSDEASKRKSVLSKLSNDKDQALHAYKNFMHAECMALVEPVVYEHEASRTETRSVTGNSKIEDWRLFCIQEKSIYATLNLCQDDLTLRVNCWYPKSDEDNIKKILEKGNRGATMQAALVKYDSIGGRHPPTFIQVNDFTGPWQEVINTYGIPNYGSANPACVTTVTFPFIFGMMYGDIGHGLLLTCIGAMLCMFSGQFKYGSLAPLHEARFLVLQLGMFATFAGFMYNDFFGMTSFQLFESRYECVAPCTHGEGGWTPIEGFDTTNEGNGFGPYPFGIDWAWHGSSNELLYVNSLKMKLSVLMGVIQMTFGLCLRVSNALHDRSKTDFICECFPMFVFMICFFGFMDYMILFKWTHVIAVDTVTGTDGPPSIINSLICMAMGQEDKQPLWGGAGDFAHMLMACAAAAVPIMLFPKPFILLSMHNAQEAKKAKGELLDEESAGGGHGHGHGEFEFGEIFIHQIIETIEYVLGTVSHTASYLRIWALSLAHQQLSLVFFQKTLMMAFTSEVPGIAGGVITFLAFGAWFGVTSGVLLGMDVLECFLHTLRLHWVEFQSKFYKSDSGVALDDYSIRKMITETA